jgi:drug/metabolite transporter (DMT)-like permease
MHLGIFFVLSACLAWSLVFVIPEFLVGFSALEISLARFFFFGLVSVVLLFTSRKKLLSRAYMSAWIKASWLGFVSSIVCYTATIFCIQYSGSAVATMLFGIVPIGVSLYGNLKKKEYPTYYFLWPCLIMGLGTVLTNLGAFAVQAESLSSHLFGLFCGIVGVLCWIGYVIITFDYMEENQHIDSIDWVVMIGASLLCFIVFTGLVLACTTDVLEKYARLSQEVWPFFGWTFVLGTVCSWLALYLWTQGNLRLPVSLAGQLVIFQLIFGLILVYSYHKRLPLPIEMTGIACMLIGVLFHPISNRCKSALVYIKKSVSKTGL